jgi:Fe/S biogenesis protein NfuA
MNAIGAIMIEITTAAQQKLLDLWADKKQNSLGLLIGIGGRNPHSFEYILRFPDKDENVDYETATEIGDLPILVMRESIDNLKGATIDFTAIGGGFRIDNPNPLWNWSDPLAQAVQDVLTNEVNPRVASHGGMITLLEVKDNVAYIEMGGGCVGCGLVDVTLKQGVEVAIKAAIPEIVAIVDRTDHASGTNPYFQESKGGGAHHEPEKGGGAHHEPEKGGSPPSSPFA